MGRWDFSGKRECDRMNQLEIWWLKRNGYLSGFRSGTVITRSGWFNNETYTRIEVSLIGDLRRKSQRGIYINNENPDWLEKYIFFEGKYKIRLITTHCNYGGVRYWFECLCGNRVGILYLGGDFFRCRHCYDLTYSSKNAGYSVTSFAKLERLRNNIKREYYNGKMTKRYLGWLKKKLHTYDVIKKINKK